MKRKWFLQPVVVLAAILALSMTAFAAWRLLSPGEAAREIGYPALAAAFQGEDAVLIGETKSQAGYEITLLGIVSGKHLTELSPDVNTVKTYAVVAIAKQNGTMPQLDDAAFDETPFFVSPLIKGQKPWQVNIASMGGGYATSVVNNVLYRMIECDDIQVFADRGLSLCVSSTPFYSTDAFDYSESTGTVTPRPGFDGVNVLFDLPLDASKADPARAQAYLAGMWNSPDESAPDDAPVEKELVIHEDGTVTENGPSAPGRKAMTLDEMEKWTQKKLAELRKNVEQGLYSEASLKLDEKEFEQALKAIRDGATVYLQEFEDGSYLLETHAPNAESGGLVFGSDPAP